VAKVAQPDDINSCAHGTSIRLIFLEIFEHIYAP
jgi:hypothetical protein